MALIKVNIEGLQANKQAISQKINQLQSYNTRLSSILAQIESGWEGEASKKYAETMRVYQGKAEQMVNVLYEFQSYMDQAAARFEQQDKTGGAKIRSC